MVKKILVFNVGSSSIKFSLFDGTDKVETGNYERLKTSQDYEKAVKKILDKFKDIKIDAIAHRIVHGGELNKPTKITKKVKDTIKEFSVFAPLHNPKQLKVVEIIEKNSKKDQYAVFDTMFFANLPEVSKNYALPKTIVKENNIRRYGFHGLSHKFVSQGLKGKIITCHLGSGSSISAIINGKPIDTSMGLTPLEGLIMGTRSGNIDPGIILHLEKKGYNVNEILNEKSGLKGISGHNDFRDILSTMNKDKDSKLAYDMFIYQIVKIVGSYVAAMNGLNNLVFTAAIGENVAKLRKDVCAHFEFMGTKLNNKRNKKNEEVISSIGSKVKVFVKRTNEEKMIVEEVLKII